MKARVRQLLDIVHPDTLRRLGRAGMLGPLTPVGVGSALPWLLGRGPSLGLASQIDSVVVGNKTAIVDSYGTITWKAINADANRTARAFARLGLGGRDRVAMLLRNDRVLVTALLGAQKLGIVASPMNTWARAHELDAAFDATQPRALIYDGAHADQAGAVARAGMAVIHAGEGRPLAGAIPFDDLIASESALPPAPFAPRAGNPSIIIHTSGTTGVPKGAQRDASAASLGEIAKIFDVVPYRRDDIVYCPAPMFHSFGLLTFTLAAVLGATLVLPRSFTPERALVEMSEHAVTAASLVPIMIRRVCELADDVRAPYDLARLRIVLASGSALPAALRSRARAVFGDVLYDLYGSTEAGWIAIATPEDLQRRPGSVGRPVPGIEVAAFGPHGERLTPGARGEISVRSAVTFEGYTSGDARERREGFLSTGDVGRIDDDGYVYVEGRADDMVNVGGENVYPVEVEEAIEALDAVEEAAVAGIDDAEYGQVLIAFIAGDVSEREVLEHCARELASYKVPRRVVIVERFPRTATGKIVKSELLATLAPHGGPGAPR